MSTKSSIILTNDNEHWYVEGSEQITSPTGTHLGYPIVMEFDPKNFRLLENAEQGLIIELINPESEIYKCVAAMRDIEDKIRKQR